MVAFNLENQASVRAVSASASSEGIVSGGARGALRSVGAEGARLWAAGRSVSVFQVLGFPPGDFTVQVDDNGSEEAGDGDHIYNLYNTLTYIL